MHTTFLVFQIFFSQSLIDLGAFLCHPSTCGEC